MLTSARCTAVIPCLNEAGVIARVVHDVREHLDSVIVVDDGSSDKTAPNARAAGATVIRHELNQGKGSALAAGFRQALAAGYEWALAMDGDGQHLACDIPSFLARAERSNARMFVGNRMEDAGAMPLFRRWVNRWMSATLSRFCGTELPDSQCGFRLVHLASWNQFEWRSEHFEIESELLVRFLHAGLKAEFVPVHTIYTGGRSKIHPLRDTIRWFRWWREIRRELAIEGRAPFFSKTPDIPRAVAK